MIRLEEQPDLTSIRKRLEAHAEACREAPTWPASWVRTTYRGSLCQ